MYQHGGNIYQYQHCIDFSSNINFYGLPKEVSDAAKQAVDLCIHYPDVDCRALKDAIRKKDGIEKAEIFCGNGAADVIFTLVRAKQPQRALILAPGFQEYEQALQSVGCQIQVWDLKEADGFALTEDLIPMLDASLDMIFLCNPNNPTGEVIDGSLLKTILQKCQQEDILLVLDECFNEFLAHPEENSLLGQTEEIEQLFILKAFTKMYAMPGLRLGYGVCLDQELVRSMELVSQPWRVSIPAQEAGRVAAGMQTFVDESRAGILQAKADMLKAFTDLGLVTFGSRANYIFFKAREDLFEKLLAKGFLIRDCSNYRGLGPGYFRVAVRQPEDNAALVAAIKEINEEN